MQKNFSGILKDSLIPILVALIPFFPTIYDYLTERDVHFVYEHRNKKSPVDEWNRFLTRMLSKVDSLENAAKARIPEPILKTIGQEIYKSLPAMLSGIGFHPMEASTVWIANVSGKELRNIKVHFRGCEGFDSYEAGPDSLAGVQNPPPKELKGKDWVSLRYEKLAPSADFESTAYMTYYGEDTSNCQPTVEAEINGKPAIGIRKSIHEFKDEYKLNEQQSQRRADLIFRISLAAAVVYIYLKVRKIEKKNLP